ncbi:hypothetical protein FDC49_19395 [Clostridium sporogenes]|uniref:YopX family protein n=1 Tax=Clostridium sporogenes TaxID=1509 RepID=UPI0013D09B13|nr:YopX family protein [Clostridium sporogenes]NFH34503.1 hypothetical protein [Clostridium sporogenes]NFL21860.1 hypothetical protein [Clostridium sporogenes]NFN74367.1 hypothetical protein [Clostridium sporogenes]NFV23812.1 hypothetical protein [Clostridium sporogenes]
MREIKFRFWDNVINNMYYGEEVSKSKNELRHNWYCITKEKGLMVGNVGPSGMDNYDLIIMQYTGLKDKNGVEIYEGDIVKIVSKVTGLFTKGKVVQGYGCFLVQYDWNTHLLCEFHNIEVIGNIYANPELVEV